MSEIMRKMLASALVVFCLLCAAAVAVSTEPMECPESFVLLHGRCYHFGSQQSTWYEAFQHCTNLRSDLVSLESAKELFTIISYLMSLKGRNRGWLTSGNDELHEGKWVWIGSETPVGFSRWCPGQPDNANNSEHCLHLAYLKDEICWNDIPCHVNHQWNKEPLYYICETDPYKTEHLCPM